LTFAAFYLMNGNMSETAKGEKTKPTDEQLRGELESLEHKRERYKTGIAEMDNRIKELRKALNIKAD